MSHKEALTAQIFTLVDCLYEKGMVTIVTSPGSRSTPLALAAEVHPGIRTFIHPDERSAAFFALGLSKSQKTPVGLICTSGTAAANYTPAVAEADLSHVPLIVLTADRPAELRNVGAPQAILQNDMYQNYVRYFTELPVAESGQSQAFIIDNKVRQAAVNFDGVTRGPVHFNIPTREPLMPDLSRVDLFTRKLSINASRTLLENVKSIQGNILVILGYTDENLINLEALSYGNVTVVADPRQHYRVNQPQNITHHDLIFLSLTEEQANHLDQGFDYILRVGEPVTSKVTNQFLQKTSIPQIVVSEYQNIKTFPAPPVESFTGNVSQILNDMITPGAPGDIHRWMADIEAGVRKMVETKTGRYHDEGRYTFEILNHLDKTHALFLSSSMPIRDYERYHIEDKHYVFGNRGANGIDGVVSTALGMSVGRKMTLVIGDIALFHDMNGLVMAKLEDLDINIIVFNNNGGGIFSYLPQYENQDHFERLFGTPLNLDFKHTADLYDFNYTKINEVEELSDEILNAGGRNLIEITTDRKENLESHQSLKNEIIKWVQSFA